MSEHLHVPFVDRGGLLVGCEILPWTEGDEEEYEVFEITRETTPGNFVNFVKRRRIPLLLARPLQPQNLTAKVKQTLILRQFPGVYDYLIPEPHDENEPYYFDPKDANRVTLGHAATMSIENERTSYTPADDLIAYLS